MGQEYGHAYEDLLELALIQILPTLDQGNKVFRISPTRRMRGVTFDIDHLIEASEDGQNWLPFVLFMEKHSDSMDNSHLHFRRHLEEYIQAKVSSIQNFNFEPTSSINVVNLIYGKEDGWKQTIINESKRLIWPTLYLVEEPYYEEISRIVSEAVSQCHPPYHREVIQRNLAIQSRGNDAFIAFRNRVCEHLLLESKMAPEVQINWLGNEVTRALEYSEISSETPAYTYIRRTLTELLILIPDYRAPILTFLENASTLNLSSTQGITPKMFQALQLAFSGSSMNRSIVGFQFIPSSIMRAFPRGIWLRSQLELIDQIFFDSLNRYQMTSGDYLAYFDIKDERFIEVAEAACHSTKALLQGDAEIMVDFLMQPCSECSVAKVAINRPQGRIQNLHLESAMALASCIAKVVTNARIDLSTSTLAKHAGVSESRINKARSSTITDFEFATGLTIGISAFFESLGIEDISTTIRAIDGEITKFHEWQSWSYDQNLASPPRIPDILNPSTTMSLGC